jgi:hypothetical protein
MTDDNNPADPVRALVPHTTAEGLATIFLPRPVVERLLRDRGWTRTDPRCPWHAPTGEQFWELDEALRAALSAEALDPARNQQRPPMIDTDTRRELINTILAHDALLDEVDALLYEHVVDGRHQPAAVAAELRRLTLAALAAATPQDWHQITEHLIADVRELEADARHNPKTDPPRSPER